MEKKKKLLPFLALLSCLLWLSCNDEPEVQDEEVTRFVEVDYPTPNVAPDSVNEILGVVLHHTVLSVVDVRNSADNNGARFREFGLVVDDRSLDFGGEGRLDFESGKGPGCGDVVHLHSFTRSVNIFEVIVEIRGNLQLLAILREVVLHLVLDGDFFVAGTAAAIVVAVLTVTGHGYQTAQAYRHQDKQVSFHFHLF